MKTTFLLIVHALLNHLGNGLSVGHLYQRGHGNVSEHDQQVNTIPDYVLENNAYTSLSNNCSVSEEDIFVNCSNSGLKFVPNLPKGSIEINLSHNEIERINDTSLNGLVHLRVLNLSDNPLLFIAPKAFVGLHRLSKLYLAQSNLSGISLEYADSLVSDLRSLTEFSLTFKYDCYGNTQVFCFCGAGLPIAVTRLNKVTNLELDSNLFSQFNRVDSRTNESISWSVRYLAIHNSEFCFYATMSTECFISTPKLSSLKIYNGINYYGKLETNAFQQLEQLNELVIDYRLCVCSLYDPLVHEIIYNTSTAINSLQTFTSLAIHGISGGTAVTFPLTTALKPLTQSRSIASIDISYGFLKGFTESVVFPSSLKMLNFSKNCLSLQLLRPMLDANPQLKTFDAGYQNVCKRDIEAKPYPQPLEDTLEQLHVQSIQSSSNKSRNARTQYQLERFIFTHSYYPMNLTLPFKQLTYIDASWNSNKNMFINAKLNDYPLLEYLDVSGNSLETIDENALNHNRTKYLYIASNLLGKMGCSISQIFHFLPLLAELDLSNNRIGCLSKDIFTDMKHLRVLNLSRNILETFEASINGLVAIELLDLSNNHIQTLSKHNMDELDLLFQMRANFSVDLRSNSLSCSCDSLAFLRWIQDSSVGKHFIGLKQYVCTNKVSSQTHFDDVVNIVRELDDKCASHTVIIVTSAASIAFCLALVTAGLFYRFRWRLRYMYYVTKLHIKSKSQTDGYEQVYGFDAFLIYEQDDNAIGEVEAIKHLAVNERIRLRLLHRECMPGEFIGVPELSQQTDCQEEIIGRVGTSIQQDINIGIHDSRWTVLFMSRAFLANGDCMYAMYIALQDSLYKKKDNLLVVMTEEIPMSEIKLEVRDFINTYTYLEYSRRSSHDEENEFWATCAQLIRST